MSDERSCFNCEYLHMGRCMNVRSKFFDDECEKVKICGAWREKYDTENKSDLISREALKKGIRRPNDKF